jgi:hypothetical protein
MDVQIGDRFTDEEGEGKVVSHPATLHGPKSCARGYRGRPFPRATEK